MMPASVKNVLIGLFVLAALGVITYMLLFLHPKVGDNAKTIRVRFTDIDKVNIGTRVTFAGKPVGEVISIRELPEARTGRISQRGEIYVYELVLKVDSGVDVFNSDTIILRTSGLLGERNVEINPQPLEPGQIIKNVENDILYAEQTSTVEDTMKEIGGLTKKFGTVLDDFHQMMTEIQNEEIVHKVKNGLQNIVDITQSLNQPEKWQRTMDNIVHLSDRAHHSLDTLDETLDNFHVVSIKVKDSSQTLQEALEGLRTTADHAVSFSEKANQVIDHTLQGKGTIGQLFMNDDSYLRIKSILHKGEVVMNDINSYGLLFHSNKRWQRLQARRIRLLEQLSNPMLFSQHFNEEMNLISEALSRVSLSLDESECYPSSLLHNPEFTKRFSELLQRVEKMDENLKLYNEQVIDQEQFLCN